MLVLLRMADVDNLLLHENLWTPESGSGTYLIFGDQFNPNDAYEGEQYIFAYLSFK